MNKLLNKTKKKPWIVASWIAVLSNSSTALTSAPCSTKYLTASVCPAKWSRWPKLDMSKF